MKSNVLFFAILTFTTFLSFNTYAESESVVEVTGLPGTTIKFVYTKHDNPIAHIVAFPGGKGYMNISDGMFGVDFGNYSDRSFTVYIRNKLRSLGFSVAVVDHPSNKGAKMGRFRESRKHGKNILAIINRMKQDADVPVWLYGHSRGTIAAASQTINLGKENVQGVVLSGSIGGGPNHNTYVRDMPLENINVPALVMSADNDLCDWTPKEDAVVIGKKLVNSPNVKVKYHKGADPHKHDKVCRSGSAHSYNGIEHKVTDHIVAFIKENI